MTGLLPEIVKETNIKCPACGTDHAEGSTKAELGRIYRCRKCNHTFYGPE